MPFLSPQLIIYCIGCLDFTAVGMLLPLLSSHIVEFGASPSLTGFISSMYGGVQLFSSPIMGSWSDTAGRKKALLISLIGTVLGYLFMGLSSNIPLLIMARMFLALFKHTQTLCRAYLADITQPAERSKVFGVFNSSSSIGFIIGPIIGGHIGELPNGFFIVCLIASITFIITGVIVQIMVSDVTVNNTNDKTKVEEKSNIQSLKEVPWKDFLNFFLLRFLLTFAVILYRSNNTIIMKETLGLSKTTLGYVVSFQGFASSVAGFGMGYLVKLYKYQHQKLLFHAIFLQGVSFIGLTFTKNLSQTLLFLLLLCISNTVCRIGVTKLIVDKTKIDQLGAVMGVSQSVTSVSRTIAPICGGLLQELSLWSTNLVATTGSIFAFVLLATLVSKENVPKKLN